MTDEELYALARSGGDCTAELRRRFDEGRVAWGGSVTLPAARCRTTDTLTIGGNPSGLPSGGGAPVSVFGTPGVSAIHYDGPADRPAVRIDRMWGYRLQGFSVSRADGSKQGVGIEVAPIPGFPDPPGSAFGTVGGNAVWDQVSVHNFGTGVKLGDVARGLATSEITFVHCVFGNNDVGMLIEDFNTLNLVFINLGIGGNRIGLHADTGGRVTVVGGTASGNTECDFWVVHAHNAAFTGFRSEGANCGFRGPGVTAPQGVSITNCSVNQRADCTEPAVRFGAGGRVALRECWLGGGRDAGRDWTNEGILIESNGGGCTALIENCMIRSRRPFTVGVLNASDHCEAHVTVRGCSEIDGSNNFVRRFADGGGRYTNRGNWLPDHLNAPSSPWPEWGP